MRLKDIVERQIPPTAWSEGDNIPWDDPAVSERMLAEHLSQQHNLASRRLDVIDRQVEWIHQEVLKSDPTQVLDVTCGPGLYTNRLAALGHTCVGIDFSPASIRYARERAERERVDCTYHQANVREADFGSGFGMAMMLFGQLNVFRRNDARAILARACGALNPGGRLLLEPQRFETVERGGKEGSSWQTCGEGGGLFSDRPHLCLSESFWDPGGRRSTERYYIVDAESGVVVRHAITNEAYTGQEFDQLLTEVGFTDVRLYPSLVGVEVEERSQAANLAVVARKPVALSE